MSRYEVEGPTTTEVALELAVNWAEIFEDNLNLKRDGTVMLG